MASGPTNIIDVFQEEYNKDEVPNSYAVKNYLTTIPSGYQPGFFYTTNGNDFTMANMIFSIPNYASRTGVDIIYFGKTGGYAGPRPDPSNNMIILDWDRSIYTWLEYSSPMNQHEFNWRNKDNDGNPISDFQIYYIRNRYNGQDGLRGFGFQLWNSSDPQIVLYPTFNAVDYTLSPATWNEFTKIHGW